MVYFPALPVRSYDCQINENMSHYIVGAIHVFNILVVFIRIFCLSARVDSVLRLLTCTSEQSCTVQRASENEKKNTKK